MALKLSSKPIIIAATASAVVFGVGGYIWNEDHRPQVLDIYVFNLSSGRSMFIRTPDDYRVLIDGGSNSDVIRELTKIIPFYSRRIDTLIATNTDGKNVSGLIDLLNRYRVDEIYLPAVTLHNLGLASDTDPIYQALLQRIADTKVPVHEIAAGNTILFGKAVSAKIHFPVEPADFVYSRASAPEVLFTLKFAATSVTFLGNASHKVQEFLAATSSHVTATDAVIVSHSALPANMSVRLMNELKPKFLVYSKQLASANNSGTASKPAATLKKKSAKIPPDPLASISIDHRLNIKEIGTIHVVSDGTSLTIK